MALSRLYYTQAECTLDDASTTVLVYKSFVYGVMAFLLGLKTGTTGTSGTPPVGSLWTHEWSCDSVTATDNGTNRWGVVFDATKLVLSASGATPKSWCVLKSPTTITALGVPFYLTIGLQGTTSGFYMALSKTRPSGGTVNVIPTATDTTLMWNITQAFSDVTAAVHKMHYVTSATGAFHIDIDRTGQGRGHTFLGVWDFSGPEITGDLSPLCVFFSSVASARGAPASGSQFFGNGYNTGSVASGSGVGARSRLNDANSGTAEGTGIMYPGNNSGGWFALAHLNPDARQEALSCRYLWQLNASFLSYIKGTLPDWWLANASKTQGLVDPPTGASEYICLGNVWVPNGGVPHIM